MSIKALRTQLGDICPACQRQMIFAKLSELAGPVISESWRDGERGFSVRVPHLVMEDLKSREATIDHIFPKSKGGGLPCV